MRLLADAIDQQLWCFGRDINHPHGNLPMRYGFVRKRTPLAVGGSSSYTLECAGGFECSAWGFGLTMGRPADLDTPWLVMRRHPFRMELVHPDECRTAVWRVEQLPSGNAVLDHSARAPLCSQLHAMARVLAGYEAWVLASEGGLYRLRCEVERPRHQRRRLRVGASGLAQYWAQLTEP